MAKKELHKIILLVAFLLTISSCITPRKVNYLQDMGDLSQIQLENKFEAVISPYDELNIIVSSLDPELAKPFNIGEFSGTSMAGRSGYLVDVNGNIQFPVLGELHVAGMTRLQLQDTISLFLQTDGYIADPFVQVRFASFKIFFLGASGGKTINIPNERCTFLEALALSGDLDLYTDRAKIAVMREVKGKMVMHYLDPRSSKVFNDPFFMLQQNDFIITDEYNRNTFQGEVNYWMNWLSMGISVASLVSSLLIYGSLTRY